MYQQIKTIKELFSSLSDTFLENVLVKLIGNKSKSLEDLTYASYSPYSKSKVIDGKIDKETFETKSESLIADYVSGKINYSEFKKKYKASPTNFRKIHKSKQNNREQTTPPALLRT
mgnify:CR=1 FL=1